MVVMVIQSILLRMSPPLGQGRGGGHGHTQPSSEQGGGRSGPDLGDLGPDPGNPGSDPGDPGSDPGDIGPDLGSVLAVV